MFFMFSFLITTRIFGFDLEYKAKLKSYDQPVFFYISAKNDIYQNKEDLYFPEEGR
jgi:hypothetical protein